jgi:ABC-type oligopeptide transport system ATPase subunit
MPPVIEAVDLVKYFPIYGGLFGRKVEYLKAVDSVSLAIHRKPRLVG